MSLAVTDTSFEEEVLKSDVPVLVDFWAEWCQPCKMVSPIVDEIGQEYAGRVKVAKIDVDSNSKIATQYGIMSIPSLLFFKDGKVVDQVVGVIPKKAFVERLNKILG